MTSAAIALIACLCAQTPGETDRYEPQLRPAQKAPAVRIEEAPEDEAPADNAAEQEPAAAEPDEGAPLNRPRQRGSAAERDPRERSHPQLPAEEEQPRGRSHAGDDPGDALRVRHTDEAAADDRMAPVDNQGRQKLRPPEILAEALENLKSGAMVGTPLSLQAALARSTDRQQQLRIAQTYWRLCMAQAEYHWARDERDLLGHYAESETNQPGILSARASGRADVRDAQLTVAQAQQDLSDLIGARTDASPPLANDRPHVGDYNTHYESIFTSSRLPPPRIRLIHRMLPGRRKAIDAHAEAIIASLDALEATGEDFRQHGKGLATMLAMLEQLKRERRAFSTEVRAYNQEIAEYAFAVAPPGANGQTLVSMLIKTAPRTQEPPRNRSGSRAPQINRKASTPEAQVVDETPAIEQTANYQSGDDETGVYQGLLDVDPALRVQKLANLLHWDRNLPTDGSEPATLAECLRGVPANRRMNVITAFWRAREQAARYQALADQVEQLASLPALAINQRHEPGLGVRVQAIRRSARAALADANVQLIAAEFELTEAAGRRYDDPWLIPSTPPQSGRYLVAPDTRSLSGAPAPRLGELVRLQHAKLEERADGVIQADVERASLLTQVRRGEASQRAADIDEMPLDVALRALARQNQETLTFLHDLTEYNMAIARFALAVWPTGVSNDELVKKLVIARSTRRDT